jgi:hypothetical protein
MKEGVVIDSKTKETYPDPLSIDFSSFEYTEPAIKVEPDETIAQKPYLLMSAQYGVTYYDDIILSLNNIPHLSKLMDFPFLLLPINSDLRGFMKT